MVMRRICCWPVESSVTLLLLDVDILFVFFPEDEGEKAKRESRPNWMAQRDQRKECSEIGDDMLGWLFCFFLEVSFRS